MFRTNLSSGPSEGHVVFSLHGELDLVDAAAVAAALGALAARDLWITVDLSGLEFIDAAGVAALSRARRQARNAGGGLVLAAPQPQVQLVLSLIWEADSSGVQASMAAAAAGAGSPPRTGAHRSGVSLLGSAGRASP
ncbi:anti-sigma factor antagonist [Trebonia kvetii]|uniref:Anti-sigma factor antagonist n=1 Tax=Trebonia kvetii TaxID=2480626 RepID=A0A6P2BXT1_9ACTN|nr:STAS domain-containing protein [Trebonia kvetii]TVZ03874.1 anti-sigma factor antagonist [Trebonia kvetii]